MNALPMKQKTKSQLPIESELRLHRCCFTGHRPEKLLRSEEIIRVELEEEIRKAIGEGFTTFISGMARGIDIDAGEIVLHLRSKGFPIRLICASPYPGFETGWSTSWQHRYSSIMNVADLTRFVCPAYSRDCFMIRNEWMVNHSARVIAVFNGHPGGSKNTIDYAHKQGVDVIMIEG